MVEVNGIKYGEYRGDFRRFSVHEVWKIDEKTLFFGAIGSGLRIIKAELAPILPD